MRYTILFLALLINFYALGQPTPEYHYLDEYAHPHKSNFSAQINVGFTGLDGNSCTLGEFEDQNYFLNPHFSLGLGYQLTHYISVLTRASYYRMSCDSPTDLGGEGMVGNNFSGILAVKHSLFPAREFDEHTRDYNFYALAGAGVMLINPRNPDSGENFDGNPDFSSTALVVPLGVGGEYRLSSFFSMALELSYYLTGSDYLDAGLVETASSNSNDNFVTLGVNVSYRIPRKSFNYNNFLKLKNRPGVEE
ncbi:outer membrane beta-barrel protein [Cesiribacter sp. SM1]|uniref:outer membrane beta-barrel protein n=1 Tax=Cesiribacter sp. SM1 TaxID=2861196 RepID=UPI001CD235DB|nr:outer membrane beta-barrel protein [Cesiribacter sp. SM1]